MNNKLGRRLKYFRERARKSQFKLEVEIEASSGTISRIEQGKVNPTKETVMKMASILSLNTLEINYLIGINSDPASLEEVESACNEVLSHYSNQTIGYLIDDRWRIFMVSDKFKRVLGLSSKDVENLTGKVMIEILLNPDLGVVSKFDKDEYIPLLKRNLVHYYVSNAFMIDDEFFLNTKNIIQQHPIASKMWDELNINPKPKYELNSNSKVYFDVFGVNIPFIYNYESLLQNSRFQFVEYTADNKFLKLLTKLL